MLIEGNAAGADVTPFPHDHDFARPFHFWHHSNVRFPITHVSGAGLKVKPSGVQEVTDVSRELGMVLEQEPMRRIGVDLEPGVRQEPREQI